MAVHDVSGSIMEVFYRAHVQASRQLIFFAVHPNFHWPNIFATVFPSFTVKFFSQWLGYLDVAIAKNLRNCMSQIYSTRLHASFGNLTQWQHLNNLLWFYKRGKCQWNSRGICHIFATIFAKQILAAKIFGQWKSGDYYWSQIVWLGKTSHVTYNIQSECCIANYSTL